MPFIINAMSQINDINSIKINDNIKIAIQECRRSIWFITLAVETNIKRPIRRNKEDKANVGLR